VNLIQAVEFVVETKFENHSRLIPLEEDLFGEKLVAFLTIFNR
jgi:hypothetical protein